MIADLLGQWAEGSDPLYRQLAGSVAALIADGTLRAGDRLPPERTLAQSLSVSRGTVVRAFEQLAEQGYVERIQGSGTTICGNDIASLRSDAFIGERLWTGDHQSVDLLKAIPAITPTVLDVIASTDLQSFRADLDGAEPLGWWPLRERVAELYGRYGVPTTGHQVMITSGAQQGISLTIAALVRPGDVVLGEDYTWPGLVDGVQHVGARFEPIAMDDNGIDADDLERLIVRFRPALISLNPQHQNPTGTRLSEERVRRVASLVCKYRVPIIEDRVAADLAFDRQRMPIIDGHDTGGHGITVGSVCKVAWPGMRLGWLRADPQIINRLRSYKAVQDMFSSALSQAAAMAMIGRYDELVAERVAQLRSRADVIIEALRADFPDWRFVAPRGGLCVWVGLPAGVSSEAFVQHAARCGVQVGSCAQFRAIDADTGHIRIPFTAPEPVLTEGMHRLTEAWKTFNTASPTPAVI